VLTADLKPVVLPEEGIVISKSVAELLDLRRGDKVEIEVLEGRRQTLLQPVSAVIEGYIGLTAFMNIGALNRALDEGTMISGVNIAFDPLHRIDLFTALKATPMANFIALQYVSVARFRETLAQNITIMITLYTALAGIIAFGVVYNFARISLSEQGREMASLRVLGFTKGEVAALILGELATVVILAQPLGWLIGYGFAYAVVSGFSTELYRVPLIINRDVYAWSSIIVIAAAVISGLLVRRRIDRLDMIAVLKTRE
jgi:putative ABC transport system permease protein